MQWDVLRLTAFKNTSFSFVTLCLDNIMKVNEYNPVKLLFLSTDLVAKGMEESDAFIYLFIHSFI